MLRVDYGVLDQIEQSLHRVADSFERMQAHRGGLEGVWGSADVRRRMDEFTSNWNVHRARLTEEIKEVGARCAECSRAFRELDRMNAALPGLGQ